MAKTSRQTKYPDTEYFHFYNANPHNRYTDDCIIRALCTVTNLSWEDVATELFKIGLKKGYTQLDNKTFEIFLAEHNFVKCNEPRDIYNKKLKVNEWLQHNKTTKSLIVAIVGSHHIVAIIDNKVNDIWDSSNETMHSYWMKG